MEHDALQEMLKQEEQEQEPAYKHFMRMEPVRRVEAEVFTDEEGRRYELREIGMLRNDKHPKPMRVYLDPAPHILTDDPAPLRGWYQPKHDPGHRPRPCFTEAVLTTPYGGSCPIRCSFCYVDSGTRGYRSQGITVVPRNYGAFVRKSLAKMKTATAGYFSSFTS